ncbi:MAG: methionyl-tRNA formyltransferase [Alphaproteobacteria bacterium]
MRLVFMGTPDFSVASLAALHEAGHEIACVYAQPPARIGRGKKERPQPTHQWALDHGLEVRTPKSLKDENEQAAFADLNVDAAVVVAYGLILPKAILDAPKHGCFNIHASLLPRWRGAAPIQRAIMAGDAETGVAIMQMEEGLDTGPVAMEMRQPISDTMTAGELHDVLAAEGADLIVAALAKLARGTLDFTPQAAEGVTYAHKIDKAEAQIDFTKPAAQVAAHIRGLSPFPGAYTTLNGERLKLLNATAVAGDGTPGTTLNDTLTIACGSGAVQISQAQRAGKGPMQVADMLRGFPIPQGTKLGA